LISSFNFGKPYSHGGLTFLLIALLYCQPSVILPLLLSIFIPVVVLVVAVVVPVVVAVIVAIIVAIVTIVVVAVIVAVLIIPRLPISIRIRIRVVVIVTTSSSSVPVRSTLTLLKLIITTPLRRALKLVKRLPVHAERSLRISRIGNRRCFNATKGLVESLKVG
jgi:hypothetical protein